MPGAVFAERGEATIAARAVNAFGKHTATSELVVAVGLSASHAASLISAAARGYLVRHAPELGHVRDAIQRARRSSRGVNILPKPIAPKPPKAVTHARSAVTVTVVAETDGDASHQRYRVAAHSDGETIASVSKRFSDFHQLRQRLLDCLRGHFMAESASVIEFPSKATVRGRRGTSEQLAQKREAMLARWLNTILEIELRCRDDRPALQGMLLSWLGAAPTQPQAGVMGARGTWAGASGPGAFVAPEPLRRSGSE